MLTNEDPRAASLQQIRLELGAAAVCLIDGSTGMLIAASRDDYCTARSDLDTVAVGCTDVVRSQEMLAAAMATTSQVEDIMVVTGDCFHIYHPVPEQSPLFIWAVIDREDHTLARARIQLERLTRILLAGPATALLAG